MQGRRTGTLTDAETYRLVFEEGAVVREVAASEGVNRQGIYLRLSRERARRAAAGLPIHHGVRGRRRDGAKPGVQVSMPPARQAAAAEAMYEGIFDGLNAAIARLETRVGATA